MIPAAHPVVDDFGSSGSVTRPEPAYSTDLGDLRSIVDALAVERVLLVVDRGAVSATGIESDIEAELDGLHVTAFDAFSPNPTSLEGLAAATLASDVDAEAVIGIGGGSCLDIAKMAAVGGRHPDIAASLIRGEDTERSRPLPIVAVPTTSGTGSEATHFAAIYVDGRKVSVAHPDLRPVGVVLDARLHAAMPPSVATASGLDALGQAMESTWAVGSTSASRLDSAVARSLLRTHFESSVRTADLMAREACMFAAHFAGRAINVSKTTASHALSYQLTQGFGLAHGHAVALTLGYVARWNAGVRDADCMDPRGPRFVCRRVHEACSALGAEPDDAPGVMRAMIDRLGLPSTLRDAGVPRDAIARLASRVDPIRLGNNPRRLGRGDIERLLEEAWDGRGTAASRR